MYIYLYNQNSKLQLSPTLEQKIQSELSKMRIQGDIKRFDSEQSLATALVNIDKSSTNTLVVIGGDEDLEIVIGQLSKLKEDLAVGYLPLADSSLSRSLNIKDWLSGIQALSQRKIKEIKIYSVGGRYFLSKIILNFEKNNSKLPIGITTESSLGLSLPLSTLAVKNFHGDNFHPAKPLILTAQKVSDQPSSNVSPIIKLIKTKTHVGSNDTGQILHLPIRAAKISFEGPITDSFGRNYKSPMIIGKTSRTIRLISRKSSR